MNLVSIRLQRSASLFAPSGEFSSSFNWEGSCASSFCLYFSYSVRLGKTIICCILGRLFIWGRAPGCLHGFTIFYFLFLFLFGMRAAFGLDTCCHFPSCVQTIIPYSGCAGAQPVSASRVGAMGNACRRHLVARPLTVVGTHAEVGAVQCPESLAVTVAGCVLWEGWGWREAYRSQLQGPPKWRPLR